MMKKLKETDFYHRCDWCVQKEPKLKPVIDKFGYPPFWHREPNFATLVLTILEQQVSLASAKTTYDKLVEKIKTVTSENIIGLTEEELRQCYFSKQKTGYTKILAEELHSGRLKLSELNELPEKKIRSRLTQIKGIGNWTVDMYLLMSLHFSDIFPPGDLATIKSVYELELVSPNSSVENITDYMKIFSPYRSVATYILWHSYIKRRNLKLE